MNFKTTEWYINKYGTQSNEPIKHTTKNVAPGVYGISIPSEDSIGNTNSVTENFFMNKLQERGINPTYSVPTKRERISATASKGFTQSFSEVFKAKLAETAPIHDEENDYKKMPFMNGNKGLTKGNFDFASKRGASASALMASRIGVTSSHTGLASMKAKFAAKPAANASSKKFYTKVPDNTPTLDKKDFLDFVALVGKISKEKASSMIKTNAVTVNNNIVTDIKYDLNTGDLVRVGIEGHYMNNNNGIAIVK